MRFQVPQFINVEDKILGPFSIKQFVYLVGGAGLVYIIYSFLPFYLAILFILPFAGLSLALAFWKPNGKPFIFLLQAAVSYALSSRLYLWKRMPKKIEPRDAYRPEGGNTVPALSKSKLKDLTWALDINQNVRDRKST